MDEKRLLLKYVDDLTMISLRFGKLHSVIESISMGMEREDMEQQAIDSIDCIGYCVSDIRNVVTEKLRQMKKETVQNT